MWERACCHTNHHVEACGVSLAFGAPFQQISDFKKVRSSIADADSFPWTVSLILQRWGGAKMEYPVFVVLMSLGAPVGMVTFVD